MPFPLPDWMSWQRISVDRQHLLHLFLSFPIRVGGKLRVLSLVRRARSCLESKVAGSGSKTIPTLNERLLLRMKHCTYDTRTIFLILDFYCRIRQVFACRSTRAFRKNVSLDSRIPASRSRGMEGVSCEHHVRTVRDRAPGHQSIPRTAMVRAPRKPISLASSARNSMFQAICA